MLGLKFYLGIGLLAAVVFLGFYIQGLRDSNEQLKEDKVVLEQSNQALEEELKELERRDDIVSQVTSEFDRIRKENKLNRDKQNQTIDNKVTEGQDRPVGPLLRDFLNGK